LSAVGTFKGNSRKTTLAFAGLVLGLLAAAPGSAGGHPRPAATVTLTAAHPGRSTTASTVAAPSSSEARATAGQAFLVNLASSGAVQDHRSRHHRHHPRSHERRHHRHWRQCHRRSHRCRGPRRIARLLLPRFHWGHRQFRYLNWLWSHESGWNRYAANPATGAYGIPQAVPGSKMASAGPGWWWNARTQIRWGLRYIRDRYGSPRGAWQHECAYGWY
jgi:hypothetical protein